MQLWDTNTYAPIGHPLRGHSDYVLSVAWSPDGRFFASADYSGKIYIYNAPFKGEELQQSHQPEWSDAYASDEVQLEDGWIKRGDSLLLWVPVAHRGSFQCGARFLIDTGAPGVTRYSVDVERLSKYSGPDWTRIHSELAD